MIFAAALGLFATAAARDAPAPVSQAAIAAARPPTQLSAYRFFRDAAAREPNTGVTPYDLNTPLWSDGALKFRYVYMPPGAQARYNSETVFEFPVGAVLIKTFAFASDMRRPTENLRFLETRLLIRRAEGWLALPYVWNEAQTEATLAPAGAILPVNFTDVDGAAVALEWAVPNRNQCKGCHDHAGEITPIGPTARNLNRSIFYPVQPYMLHDLRVEAVWQNQLAMWVERGILDQGPPDAPRVPDVYESVATLEQRARAYLDVNCAHCHNPEGPAHTSGLDLSWAQQEPVRWGVLKRPVAAGRASAGFDFSIEPGHPERSILLHRMESTDPGVMMPELGRQRADPHAVALMREWIAGMDADGRARD